MDKSCDIIIGSGAGGVISRYARHGRSFQPQVHYCARGADKLIGAAANAAGMDSWVMGVMV